MFRAFSIARSAICVISCIKLPSLAIEVENAEANKQTASENVAQSYEDNFQEVYYDNRLLNLWDSKGLNLSR